MKKTNFSTVKQIRVRSALVAGESVDACLNNLDYWTRNLQQKCSRKGQKNNSGYAPYLESEMKPWQASGV